MDYNLLAFGLTAITTLCALVWWLSNQFRDMRNLVYTKFDMLTKMFTDKMEYHERHDDQRFNSISNDIWAIRVRNAAIDAHMTPAEVAAKKKERLNA
jgi:hypothetical protein